MFQNTNENVKGEKVIQNHIDYNDSNFILKKFVGKYLNAAAKLECHPQFEKEKCINYK